MEVKIIKNSISKKELCDIAKQQFGSLVKAVVDVDRKIMAVGGEMHADEEVILMEQEESKREHTWGINLYPEKSGEEWIEFDSVINIKPSYGNHSRGVEDSESRIKIVNILNKLIVK